MADNEDVIKVKFQVDSAGLASDAEQAGKQAASAFERGFGQIKLKIPEPAAGALKGQAAEIGKALQPAAPAVPTEAVVDEGGSAGKTGSGSKSGGGGGDTGEDGGGSGGGGGGGEAHPKHPEPPSKFLSSIGNATTGVSLLRGALSGVNEVLEAGTFAAAAKGIGELAEAAEAGAKKYGLLGEGAEKFAGIVGLGGAAVGGAIGAVQIGKGYAGEAQGTIEDVAAEARMAGLRTSGLANLVEAFESKGVTRQEAAPVLGAIALKSQREKAAVNRQVELDPLDTADSQEQVAEAYRHRKDAADATATTEENIITKRAKEAVTLSGAAIKDQIAKEAGPMQVVASELGLSEAQEGQQSLQETAPLRHQEAQQAIRQAQTGQAQAGLGLQEAHQGVEGAEINLGNAHLRARQANIALRESRGEVVGDDEKERLQKDFTAQSARSANEAVREAELGVKRAKLGEVSAGDRAEGADLSLAKALQSALAEDRQIKLQQQRSSIGVQEAGLGVRSAELSEGQRKQWFDRTGSNVFGELSPEMQGDQAHRETDAAYREQQRSVGQYLAATRGVKRAESSLADLPNQQITKVADALLGAKDTGVNLKGAVSPPLLAAALTHIVQSNEKYSGPEGTHELGAIQDIHKALGDAPDMQPVYRSMLVASAQGRLDRYGADRVFRAIVGGGGMPGMTQGQMQSANEPFENEALGKVLGDDAQAKSGQFRAAVVQGHSATEVKSLETGLAVMPDLVKAIQGETKAMEVAAEAFRSGLVPAVKAGAATEGAFGEAAKRTSEFVGEKNKQADKALGFTPGTTGEIEGGVEDVAAFAGGAFLANWAKKKAIAALKEIVGKGEGAGEAAKGAGEGAGVVAEGAEQVAVKAAPAVMEGAEAAAAKVTPAVAETAAKVTPAAAEAVSSTVAKVAPAVAEVAPVAEAPLAKVEKVAAPIVKAAATGLMPVLKAGLSLIAGAAEPFNAVALTSLGDDARLASPENQAIEAEQAARGGPTISDALTHHPGANEQKYGLIGGAWQDLKEGFGFGQPAPEASQPPPFPTEQPFAASPFDMTARSLSPPPFQTELAPAQAASPSPAIAPAPAEPAPTPTPAPAAPTGAASEGAQQLGSAAQGLTGAGQSLSGAGQSLSGAGQSLAGAGQAIAGSAQGLSGAGQSLASAGQALASAASTLASAGSSHSSAPAAPSGGGGSGGGEMQEAASGGMIHGPGSGTSDSISTTMSPGDYVLKADATAHWGQGFLDTIRDGSFSDGGEVPVAVSNGEYHFPADVVQKHGLGLFHQLNAAPYRDGGPVLIRGYAGGGDVVPTNYSGFEDDPAKLAKAKKAASASGLSNSSTRRAMVNSNDQLQMHTAIFNDAMHFQSPFQFGAKGGLIVHGFDEGGQVPAGYYVNGPDGAPVWIDAGKEREFSPIVGPTPPQPIPVPTVTQAEASLAVRGGAPSPRPVVAPTPAPTGAQVSSFLAPEMAALPQQRAGSHDDRLELPQAPRAKQAALAHVEREGEEKDPGEGNVPSFSIPNLTADDRKTAEREEWNAAFRKSHQTVDYGRPTPNVAPGIASPRQIEVPQYMRTHTGASSEVDKTPGLIGDLPMGGHIGDVVRNTTLPDGASIGPARFGPEPAKPRAAAAPDNTVYPRQDSDAYIHKLDDLYPGDRSKPFAVSRPEPSLAPKSFTEKDSPAYIRQLDDLMPGNHASTARSPSRRKSDSDESMWDVDRTQRRFGGLVRRLSAGGKVNRFADGGDVSDPRRFDFSGGFGHSSVSAAASTPSLPDAGAHGGPSHTLNLTVDGRSYPTKIEGSLMDQLRQEAIWDRATSAGVSPSWNS